MHKIDSDGSSSGAWVDRNLPTTQGTLFDAAYMNAVQDELVNVILTRAGITLVKGTNTQLGSALDLLALATHPGGRLTLETGVAVGTGTGATAVRYAPYQHEKIHLYDGTRWKWYTFAELSQATTDNTKSPAAVANNTNYDVFVWDDSGTLRATRGPAWSSSTSRGTGAGTTELEVFTGRYVNKVAITNGPAARCGLYVGTVRSDGSAQVNDNQAKRHVWNMYNRVLRAMRCATETTDTWTYTTETLRQANANAANQLDFVRGLDEDMVRASVVAFAQNTSEVAVIAGIGLDSTSTLAAGCLAAPVGTSSSAIPAAPRAEWVGTPGLGRHTLTWLEWSTALGTTNFYGDNGSTLRQAGIHGETMA